MTTRQLATAILMLALLGLIVVYGGDLLATAQRAAKKALP